MRATDLEFNAFVHGFLACLRQFEIPQSDDTFKKMTDNVRKYYRDPGTFEKFETRGSDGGDRHPGAETASLWKDENL